MYTLAVEHPTLGYIYIYWTDGIEQNWPKIYLISYEEKNRINAKVASNAEWKMNGRHYENFKQKSKDALLTFEENSKVINFYLLHNNNGPTLQKLIRKWFYKLFFCHW